MLTSGLTQHVPIDVVALQVQYQALRFNSWHGCSGGISGSEWVAFRPRVPCLFKGALPEPRSSLLRICTLKKDLYILSVCVCPRLTVAGRQSVCCLCSRFCS